MVFAAIGAIRNNDWRKFLAEHISFKRYSQIPPTSFTHSKYSIQQAYNYCEKVTKKADTNFYLGFRFLPKGKRNAVFASYAFCRYVDDIVDRQKSSRLSVPELVSKWEQDLHDCYKGKAKHPIMIALAEAVREYNIPKAPFLGLIEGCRMDLRFNRYRNFKQLSQYCDRVAATISTISLHIFGVKNPRAKKYGYYLSMALQLTNILRDVGEDARKGRIYIPLDELERFGYSESELMAGVRNAAFYKLMHFQAARVRKYYQKADKLLSVIEDDSLLATGLMGAVYARVLDEIEHSNYDVFRKKAKLSALQKIMLVAKVALNPSFIR